MADNEGLDSFLYNNTNNSKSGGINESCRTTNVVDASTLNSSGYHYENDVYVYPNFTNFTTDDFCTSDYVYIYVNVTCLMPITYAEIMYRYIAPFLLVVTVVTNTLIVVVLTRPHMRTPTNVLLMAIAVCDMLTILFPAPWNFFFYTLGNHYKPLGPVATCKVWNYMNDMIPTMFHAASIWLTLALAVQRYIYVCHAPLARTWCTMRRVVHCLICISVAAFLYQLPRFLDHQFISHETVWRGHVEEVCRHEPAPWVRTLSVDAYLTTYEVFSVCFVHHIPCIMLVVFNALLIRAMRTAQINRRKLFRENRKSEANRLRESNATTLMLIFVVTIFLIPLLTITIVGVIHKISIDIVQILDIDLAKTIYMIMNFVSAFSYPVNFVIYCCMSRQFRETFKGLFIRSVVTHK